ncbi:pyocin activator PrtN family protein [Snodgrassella alvi]|uniref:pyocin activator PrtN family protein n=1 Tax=Snodgrassella alvi TaxID=1196083 RepID=UPI00351A165C
MKDNEFDFLNALIKKYGHKPAITLKEAIDDWFPDLTFETAKKKAAKQQLPFPVFKIHSSNKAPYMVRILDLANTLKRTSDIAVEDWTSMHI